MNLKAIGIILIVLCVFQLGFSFVARNEVNTLKLNYLPSSCHNGNDPKEDEFLCDCLDDVVLGKMPCGECAGGIIKGYGNYYLREYFARSLADGMGVESLTQLRKIIYEKYGIAPSEQF